MGIVYKSPITEQQLKEQVTSQQNEAKLETIRESVRAEKHDRITADNSLREELREYVDSETALRLASEINIIAQIDSETALRTAADTKLSNDIATEERARNAEILRLDDALENERVARATSESAMKSDIMNAIHEMEGRNTDADSGLTEAINAEARTRAAEDSSLNNAIEGERTDRAAAISSLRTELQTAINANNNARITAEGNLSDAIDDEALARSTEDTRLQGAITAEGTARQTALDQLQSTLQTKIDAEKTAREQAIANLNSSWAGGAGAFAPIESPSFTGVPKTTALDDSSDPLQIAPKSYVDNKLTAISENLSVFTSPTATKAGKQGQVPAPEKGSAVKILTNFGWRSPNDATVTSNTIPSQSGSLTYNGNIQEPSWVNFDESKLKISGTTSASAAGTYTAIFTPIDLYLWGDTLDQSPREVTWEIGKLRLTKPTATNTAFTYDQTQHAPTVSNYSATYMSQTGTASATNKGNYTLNYTLKDANNTCWNDGTSDKVTLKWSIAINQLAKPTISKSEYDYTGSTITLSVSGFVDKYMSQTGTASSTAVGNYTLTVVLKDKTNTTWADGTTTDISFSWKIAKKVLSADMSTGFAQTGSLTFNGNSQNVSISNYNSAYHTLGGTISASNAGTYTATISPATSYTWNDGTTTAKNITWTIAPKKIAKPVASTTSFDYDGYSKTLTVTGYDSNTMTQTGSTTATAAASYSVTYALKNKTNYNWTDGSTANVVISWEIVMRTLSAAQSTGFAQEGTLTYTGSGQTVTIKNYSSTYHVLGGVTSATEVGTYVATISPIDTYKWNDGTTAAKEITWTIGAKKLNKPAAAVTAIDYDSTSKTLGVVGYDSATMLQSGTIVASAVGSYSVSYNLKDKKNYTWSDGTTGEVKINWTIAKRTLTAEQSTGFAQDGTLTFNGSEQSVTIKNYSSSYHVLGGTLKSTSAGTFTATVSPAITHTWADGTTTPKEVTWTIAPMKITKPTASTLSFVYNGNSRNLTVSNYDSAYMTLSGTISESAVGEYEAKYALKSKINYNWADGSVADVVITWRITRAPLTSAQSTFSVEGTYTFNGANQSVQIAGYNSTYHDLSGETSASESGSHAVTIAPKASYMWNDGTTTPKEVTWNIAQKVFTPPIAATTEFAYDKAEHELTFTGYEPTYMNRLGTYKATAVGAYTVTFTLVDVNNTRWSTTTDASYSVEWSIGMTTVTIPTLQTSTFTYDGNSKAPTFTVPNAAAVTAGGTTSAVNAGSYTFTYELADTETTVWSDGSSSAKSFSWKINRKPLTSTQSSFAQSGTLNYNGSSQSILGYITNYDSNYHSIGGQIIQTDAGSYVAQITPLANYAWNDGTFDAKPVVWKISAIKIAKPTAAETTIYATGSTVTLQVENYNETYITRTGTYSATYAGNYKVEYFLKNNSSVQWADGTISSVRIDWQIVKRQIAKPVPIATEYEYDGTTKTLQVYPYDTTLISRNSRNTHVINNYSLFDSFSIIDTQVYEWDDGDDSSILFIYWNVVPAKLPAEYDSLYIEDAEYTGDSNSLDARDFMRYLDSGGNVVQMPYAYVAFAGANGKMTVDGVQYTKVAGTYSVTVTPRAEYTWANGTQETRQFTWTVKPKPIDASYSNPSLDANGTDLLYTGSAQTPTLVGYNSTYVDMSGNTSESDTGEYEITFAPKANYAWSDGTTEPKTFRWSIYKNVYVKPNASAKYTYKPAGNTLKVNNFVEGAMSQTGVASATDVGVYTAVYELVNTVNSEWADGTTAPVTISWEIERARFRFADNVYVWQPISYNGYEIDISTIASSADYYLYICESHSNSGSRVYPYQVTLGGTLKATAAGTYEASVTPTANYAWVDGGTETRYFLWTIPPKKIATNVNKIPAIDTDTVLIFDRDNAHQTPTLLNIDSDTMDVYIPVDGFGVGEYVVHITPLENYNWGLSDEVMSQYGELKLRHGYGTYTNYNAKTLTLTWRVERRPMTTRQEKVTNVNNSGFAQILYYTGSEQTCPLYRVQYPFPANSSQTSATTRVTNTSSSVTACWIAGGELSGTAVGEYTMTMTPQSNYCWSDGGTEVREVKWYIAKERLSVPTQSATASNKDYNGNAQTFNVSNMQADLVALVDSGDVKITHTEGISLENTAPDYKFNATEVGSYFVTFTIVNTARYAWKGTVTDAEPLGTSEPLTLWYSIGTGGKTIVTKPNLLDGTQTVFAYDGTLQSLTVNGYDTETMTQTGTISATAAGTYTVTYALKDKTNCVWEGGGTSNVSFTWKIVEQAISETQGTFTARELTFNGSSQNLYLEGKGAVTATGTTSDGKLVWSGTISASNAGTYTATVAPAANYCWADGTVASKTVTWKIVPLLLTKPAADRTELTYTGAAQTLSVTNYNSTYENVTGSTTALAAGSYSATYSLKSTTNTKWEDGTTSNVKIDWSIAVAKFTKPTINGDSTFTYDGSQKSITCNGYDSATMTRTGYLSGTSAGSYDVVFALKDTTNSAWVDDTTADVTLTWVINPKPLTATQSNLQPSTAVGYTYTGSAQSLVIKNFDSSVHDISGTTSATNAGTYTAVVTPKANRCWNDGTTTAKNITWKIIKRTLNVPVITKGASQEYTGQALSPTVDLWYSNYDTYASTTGATSATNVGSHTISYTLKDSANYCWYNNGNLTETTVSVTWQITPKYLTKPTAANASLDYKGVERTLELNDYDSATMTASGITATNAGSYTATVALKDKTNYRWTSDTANDTTDVSISWTINKYYVPYDMKFTNNNATYTGSAIGITVYPLLSQANRAIFEANGTNLVTNGVVNTLFEKFYTIVSGSFSETNAGTYEFVVKPNENCVWIGSGKPGTAEERTYSWTIEKAQATLTLSLETVTITDENKDPMGVVVDVTYSNNSPGAINFQVGDTNIAGVNTHINSKTVTLHGLQNGATTITVTQKETANYYAPPSKIITVTVNRTITSLLFSDMVALARNGSLLKYGDIGDVYRTVIKKSSSFGAVNFTKDTDYYAVLVDYDAGTGSNGRATFAVMRKDKDSAENIAFTDGSYGTAVESGTAFKHADTDSSNLSWVDSKLRAICAEFYNSMYTAANIKTIDPSAIVETPVTTIDSNGTVTTVSDKIFIMDIRELAMSRIWGTARETNDNSVRISKTQVGNFTNQFEYFANGNGTIFHDYQTGEAVRVWTRTPFYPSSTNNAGYCSPKTIYGYHICNDHGISFYAATNYSYGFVPCFTIG